MSLIDNKKAGFNYEFLDKYEAGIELLGNETKSLRGGHGSLDGAYIILRGNEAFLVGAYISPYQQNNQKGGPIDPYRTRKLLLTKAEIKQLIGQDSRQGLTIVPISLYNKGRFLKLSFAVARTKKKFDKRDTIKKRETDREIRRDMKSHR